MSHEPLGISEYRVSWTEYLDKFATYKPSQELVPFVKSKDRKTVPSLLCHKDMKIYGIYPLQEELILVACNFCKKLIKFEALSKHYENNHNYAICNETVRIQFPVSSSHDCNSAEISLKRRSKPKTSQIVVQASNTDCKANPLKETNLDRQCEVWMKDRKRKCRNAFNCKLHPISLRKCLIKDRSKLYDNLFVERQGQIQPERIGTIIKNASLMHLSDQLEETAAINGSNGNELYIKNSNEDPFDNRYRRFQPVPAAVCAFGARSLTPGSYIFTRKCDKLYASLVSVIKGCGSDE